MSSLKDCQQVMLLKLRLLKREKKSTRRHVLEYLALLLNFTRLILMISRLICSVRHLLLEGRLVHLSITYSDIVCFFSGLRTPLHHRRTFSDTAFINKLFSQKETKPGPSSSGNSPSNTPAFFPPSPPNLPASSSSAAMGGVVSQLPSTPQEVGLLTHDM